MKNKEKLIFNKNAKIASFLTRSFRSFGRGVAAEQLHSSLGGLSDATGIVQQSCDVNDLAFLKQVTALELPNT